MSNKSEAEKCKSDVILKIKPSELIAEVKKKDFKQKNERKTKRNNGELDDCHEEAKIYDEGHEGNKQMKLNDEMMDLNNSFLDSGQDNNKEEESASDVRGEVAEVIENGIQTKVTEFEAEKDANKEKYEFGKQIEQE